jgi:hypothetical protein
LFGLAIKIILVLLEMLVKKLSRLVFKLVSGTFIGFAPTFCAEIGYIKKPYSLYKTSSSTLAKAPLNNEIISSDPAPQTICCGLILLISAKQLVKSTQLPSG